MIASSGRVLETGKFSTQRSTYCRRMITARHYLSTTFLRRYSRQVRSLAFHVSFYLLYLFVFLYMTCAL